MATESEDQIQTYDIIINGHSYYKPRHADALAMVLKAETDGLDYIIKHPRRDEIMSLLENINTTLIQ